MNPLYIYVHSILCVKRDSNDKIIINININNNNNNNNNNNINKKK